MEKFYTAIVNELDGDISRIHVFWSWATHIGEAISKMVECAIRQQIRNPVLLKLDPYDFENLPNEVLTDDSGKTYFSDSSYSYPTKNFYQLPYGVISSCIEGDRDIEEIQIGHKIEYFDRGLIQLIAVVDGDNLLHTYTEIIKILPSIRVFWVKILEDWENLDRREMYVNEELVDPKSIRDFLERHDIDMFLNGYLGFTSYGEQGKTNVSIDEHRLISVLSYDEILLYKMSQFLEEKKIPLKTNLVTIQDKIYHWHYRHPVSKTREETIALLRRNGFQYWKPKGNT